ncbi:MAG: TetR family transcriptional regulator [Phenylobacterium sp.]|uniref:TetR/AcrR family transcriptional regulator n=1 Tax=Phenylobacterium sp. TaxID=1871053 RepID=UPI001A43A8FF|nr:TetR/AcrR family transcriptional regulator [Phenylobacterium sp.]MBL8769923.1 TetR family transcriptional regulator [Phenylobacterium sp.]
MDRRLQIYREASALILERGFAGASMSDIAVAVGLTKAGLYHFVSSKEDLLYEIMLHGMAKLEHDVIAPALAEADPATRLEVIVRRHIRNVVGADSALRNPISIVIDEPQGLSPERRREIDARKRRYMDLIRDTLTALQARGVVRPELNPTVAAFTIIGTIMWVARWRRPNGRLSLDEISDQIVGNLLSGLRGPAA